MAGAVGNAWEFDYFSPAGSIPFQGEPDYTIRWLARSYRYTSNDELSQ